MGMWEWDVLTSELALQSAAGFESVSILKHSRSFLQTSAFPSVSQSQTTSHTGLLWNQPCLDIGSVE